MFQNGYGDLVPRNGATLKVLLICRVSSPGEGKQDIRSLDDQEALLRHWLATNVSCSVDVRVIAGSGSGERLDRRETIEAEEAVETGAYDLVLTEDLGRIFRRARAFDFCELAEDHDTRVIALNDSVDTAEENWRMAAFFAAMRHEMHNADTSKRIRRTLRNRFEQGGSLASLIYGYIKPAGAKNDVDVRKDPAADPVYDEWFRRLESGATFSDIADWLNATGVSPGPHCRNEEWDCRMVGRVTRNPILKGLRVWNVRRSRRTNKTGRRRGVKAAPEERLERECPHLAFIAPERYDRVLSLVNDRNAIYRRGKNGSDPRRGVARKRTRFDKATSLL